MKLNGVYFAVRILFLGYDTSKWPSSSLISGGIGWLKYIVREPFFSSLSAPVAAGFVKLPAADLRSPNFEARFCSLSMIETRFFMPPAAP